MIRSWNAVKGNEGGGLSIGQVMRCSAQVVKSLFMSDVVLCVQCRSMTSSDSYCPVLKQTQWLFILQTFPELWSVPLFLS